MRTTRRVQAQPLACVAPWQHARSVFVYNIDAPAFSTPQQHSAPAGNALPDDIGTAGFTCNAGDSLLICMAGIPHGSGHKLADNLSSITAFAEATNALHVSAHQARLGVSGANNIDILYSTGFESRAHFVYFDRKNMRVRTAFSSQDGTDPYGPPVFAGIVSGVGAGTDAGIGSIDISTLYLHEFAEKGPIHIIRWPTGTAPPIAVIELAMEWMWYEWVTKNNFVIYPYLSSY